MCEGAIDKDLNYFSLLLDGKIFIPEQKKRPAKNALVNFLGYNDEKTQSYIFRRIFVPVAIAVKCIPPTLEISGNQTLHTLATRELFFAGEKKELILKTSKNFFLHFLSFSLYLQLTRTYLNFFQNKNGTYLLMNSCERS